MAQDTIARALALTAQKGVEDIREQIVSVYKYKGSVATYADLPTSGNQNGDVYNVLAAYESYPAGTNFAWDGDDGHWDALGGSMAVDDSVTEDSASLVTSGAVYEAISDAKTAVLAEVDNAGYATTDYVDEQVGDIDTLLTALNTGAGV